MGGGVQLGRPGPSAHRGPGAPPWRVSAFTTPPGSTSCTGSRTWSSAPQATEPALREVEQTLSSWQTSPHLLEWQVGNAVFDALLSAGSPHLANLTDTLVRQLVAEYDKVDGLHSRRRGLIKLSRVLAGKGIIPAPLHSNESKAGPRYDVLDTVPSE